MWNSVRNNPAVLREDDLVVDLIFSAYNLEMPTVFRFEGYRFYFFSREEERKHIHVSSAEGEAKIWIEPVIEVAKSVNFSSSELGKVLKIVEAHKEA